MDIEVFFRDMDVGVPKHDPVLEHCAKITAKNDPNFNPEIAAEERERNRIIATNQEEEAKEASRYKDESKTEKKRGARI